MRSRTAVSNCVGVASGLDLTPSISELPPVLRRALAQLPSADDVESVLQGIQDSLRATDEDEQEVVLPTPGVDVGPWSEGTERFASHTPEDLYKLLGVVDGHIPGFNRTYDPNGELDSSTQAGRDFLASDASSLLQLRWHQYAAILRLMENTFEQRPMLTADEVGVGKSSQHLGHVATYANFLDFYTQSDDKCFPGMFSECRWLYALSLMILTAVCSRG